jgi:hypothetical protein
MAEVARRELEFVDRVETRMAEWARRYAEQGAQPASLVLDRVLAELQVAAEMEAE